MQGIIIIIINTIIQNKFKCNISVILPLQPLLFVVLYTQRFSIHTEHGGMPALTSHTGYARNKVITPDRQNA
jgi:hypothetical protein